MKKVIGITGGIASGKSTVSGYIRELGFTVIDADAAARIVVEPGQAAFEQIVEHFGPDILADNGTIDRPRLGAVIFNDEGERLKLNSFVHPAVRTWMEEQKAKAFLRGEKTVFMDIPLLFESRLGYMVDAVILVYVNELTQLARLMARNSFSKEEAEARIASQMPLREKKTLADAVIDNEGSREETKKQVQKLLREWDII
ncbi:dephospho-CoA kinase [Peribacillus sp. SCS-37]|uniref:dephospho-CoA kinase n=1 Tax=Paraperibacillus esterisolvens TaxID=3115296 RepID=UPI0039067828